MRLNDKSHRRRAGGGEGGDVGEKTYADICIASPGAWNKGYGFGRGWEGGMAFMFVQYVLCPGQKIQPLWDYVFMYISNREEIFFRKQKNL